METRTTREKRKIFDIPLLIFSPLVFLLVKTIKYKNSPVFLIIRYLFTYLQPTRRSSPSLRPRVPRKVEYKQSDTHIQSLISSGDSSDVDILAHFYHNKVELVLRL